MAYQGKEHFSHHHVLLPIAGAAATGNITCSACRDATFDGDAVYGCPSCDFYLHKVCLEAPRSLEHPSHPHHPLTLHPTPTYFCRSYGCDACGLPGAAFSYGCAHCEFDLHLPCAVLPETFTAAELHPHEMKRVFETPLSKEAATAVACGGCGEERRGWLYYCEECEFCMHVGCLYEKDEEIRVCGGEGEGEVHVDSSDDDGVEEGSLLVMAAEMEVLAEVIAALGLKEAVDGEDEDDDE